MRNIIKLVLIVTMLTSFNAIQTPLEVSGDTEVIVMVFKIGSKEYTINGKQYDDLAEPPEIDRRFSRTFMPIRPIVENLPGADIDWDNNTNTAIITDDDPELVMKIFVNDYVCPDNMEGKVSTDEDVCVMVEDNDYIALVNGEEYYIEAEQEDLQKQIKPYIKGGLETATTMLPLRFIGEWLGAKVDYREIGIVDEDRKEIEATLTFIEKTNTSVVDFNIDPDDTNPPTSMLRLYGAGLTTTMGEKVTVVNSIPHYKEAYKIDEKGPRVNKLSADINIDYKIPYLLYYYNPPEGEFITDISIDVESETIVFYEENYPVIELDFPIANGGDLIDSYPLYDCFSTSTTKKYGTNKFYDHFILKYINEHNVNKYTMNLDISCTSLPGENRFQIMIPTTKSITLTDGGDLIVERYSGNIKLNIDTISNVYEKRIGGLYQDEGIGFCDCQSFQESAISNSNYQRMLIIAHKKFVGTPDGNFNDLADYAQWRTNIGIQTNIITLQDIPGYGNYKTEDLIKNKIREEYADKGLDYLLLVGDVDTIPSFEKQNQINPYWCNQVYSEISSNVHTDVFYGNIGNEEHDLISEIAVGRIPARSMNDLRIYMKKALLYHEYKGNRNKMLFSKGVLFDVYRKYKGKEDDDFYIYDTSVDGTENDDLPVKHGKDMIEIIKEKVPELENTYEMKIIHSCCEDACMDRVYSAISSFNPDIINFGYHSTTMISGGMDGKAICNDHPSLFYNIGCFSNNFGGSTGWTKRINEKVIPYGNEILHNNKCFSESVLFSECNNCAVYIGNSSFGYYRPYKKDRQTSLDYQIEFFKELLKDDDITIGEAFKRSKNNMYVYCIDDINEAYRWVYDGLNLLGDPSLQFRKPHKPAVKLIIEPNAVDLKPGQSQRFEAKLFDKHGNPTSGEVEWSVAPEGVGQFWDDGMFTATADTDATGFITATCGDLVGYVCVHVITENPVPRSIKICRTEGDNAKISFKDGDQYCIKLGYDALFKAEIYDQSGEQYQPLHQVRWATNNRDVIDIIYEGPEMCRIFPKIEGKCTLTVLYDGLVDSIEIEVSNKCGKDSP